MKIFGIYIFEDPPELKEARDRLDAMNIEYNAQNCEAGFIPDLNLSVKLGAIDQVKERYKSHEKMANQGRCHIYDRQKYCYYTGKKIIIDV